MKTISHSLKYKDPVIAVDHKKEIRCSNIIRSGRLMGNICNKKLALGDIGAGGKIEVLCPRCKQKARIERLA